MPDKAMTRTHDDANEKEHHVDRVDVQHVPKYNERRRVGRRTSCLVDKLRLEELQAHHLDARQVTHVAMYERGYFAQ